MFFWDQLLKKCFVAARYPYLAFVIKILHAENIENLGDFLYIVDHRENKREIYEEDLP
jgi:hypothetical protein